MFKIKLKSLIFFFLILYLKDSGVNQSNLQNLSLKLLKILLKKLNL